MHELNQLIGIKMLTSYFLETFDSQSEVSRGKCLLVNIIVEKLLYACW